MPFGSRFICFSLKPTSEIAYLLLSSSWASRMKSPSPLRSVQARNAENQEPVANAVSLAKVARSRPKHGPVDGVVTHLHRVVLQEALSNKVAEPLRRSYERHSRGRHARKDTFLVLKVPRTARFGDRLGISVQLWACF